MPDLRLDGPINILVLLGITLPEISEADLQKIREAAPPGSTIRVIAKMRDAANVAGDAEVILGLLPESLFHAAPRLRWFHAIASGVDMFLRCAIPRWHLLAKKGWSVDTSLTQGSDCFSLSRARLPLPFA